MPLHTPSSANGLNGEPVVKSVHAFNPRIPVQASSAR